MSVMPGPFGEAITRLDRRFLTTAVIPTVIFVGGTALVATATLDVGDALLRWWSEADVATQLVASLGGGAVIWFIASLVSSNWRKIVRLYEGYPLAHWYRRRASRKRFNLRWYVRAIPGAAYHMHRLSTDRPARESYTRYAPSAYDAEVLPTTIGNILLSAERYALDRYGLDVTLFWPRLYWQLPAEQRTELDAFKEEHQLPLSLSFMAALFGLVSGVLVLATGGSWQLFVLVSVTGLSLALVAYSLSIERAEEYAEQLRSIVDLHHSALMALWAEPASDEKEFYARVQHFVEVGEFLSTTMPSMPESIDNIEVAPALVVPALNKHWIRIIRHFRLSVIVSATTLLSIAVGGAWLHSQEVDVLVAAADIRQFDAIDSSQTEYRRFAAGDVPPGAVVVGSMPIDESITLNAIRTGDPVLTSRLIRVTEVGTRQWLIDVTVDAQGGVALDLTPGREIDAQLLECRVTLRDVLLLDLRPNASPGGPATATIAVESAVRPQVAQCGDLKASFLRS